ncbi:MAG: GH36-type glycosyl hydrolase domain-containing protein [Fibrobacterota bacterium]
MAGVQKNNGSFSFSKDNEVCISEKRGDITREPWLMLLARRNKKPTETLCWGLTNNGTTFARIGTQEGDLLNGFVHEDPYKTRLLGPYAYIVDENGDYFSNTWYPVMHDGQSLDTTFGFGYVKYETSYKDFSVETTNFVPNQYDAMVQILKIKNNGSSARKIKLYNVNPINIGDARDIQFSGFNTLMMGGAIIDRDVNGVVWRNSYGIPFTDDEEKINGVFGKVAVHTTSLDNKSFGTRYDEFVGHHTNTLANPDAVTAGQELPNRDAEELTSALSSIQNEVEIGAGEEKEVVVILAAASTQDYYCEGKKELKAFLADALKPEKAWAMFEEVKKDWNDEINMLQVDVEGEEELTPSFKWLQYQCAMVALLNRMKSRFHSGFEYGYGFRDILQDLLALLPYDPARAKDLIKYTAQQMFSDGYVYHNFFVSSPGVKDFVASDDPLWLIFAVCEYIKETGDLDFLDEVVNYCDDQEGHPSAKGSIREHLEVGIKKVWDQSDEGLPYLLMADWNDDLSGLFAHTSTMAAQQLYKALNDMVDLLELKGADADLVADYKVKAQIVKKSVDTRCIDKKGDYIRAVAPKNGDTESVLNKIKPGMSGLDMDDVRKELEDSKADGNMVDLGNSETDGNVFLSTIAWAGYSGIADKERFDQCVKVCDEVLDDKYGVMLCRGDKEMTEGKLPSDDQAWKRNAPGKKENGGGFRHLESWYIASLAKFGYGKKACDVYMKTLPAKCSEDDPYNYAAERFVYPEYISGPDSNDHGKAGHTWLTGTAPTRLGVLIDWIFGVRREYNGLLIDPCVDPGWKKFSVVRHFRGSKFSISFTNTSGVEKGVKSVTVDGKAIDGQLIPVSFCDGTDHTVEVTMG